MKQKVQIVFGETDSLGQLEVKVDMPSRLKVRGVLGVMKQIIATTERNAIETVKAKKFLTLEQMDIFSKEMTFKDLIKE